MLATFAPVQPESHPVSRLDLAIQRELPLLGDLGACKFVAPEVVAGWQSYRDAVVWCWQNQTKHVGTKEKGRQVLFAVWAGMHPPHVSRCVKPDSGAPMDLPPDVIPSFESFTGWRGLSQYLMRRGQLRSLEQALAQMKEAA